MDDEWDLHAVVRSCTTTSGTAVAAVSATSVEDYDDGSYNLESVAYGNQLRGQFGFPSLGHVSGGLEDVYKVGRGTGQPPSTMGETTSTAIAIGVSGNALRHEKLPMLTDSHSFSMNSDQSTRPKKR